VSEWWSNSLMLSSLHQQSSHRLFSPVFSSLLQSFLHLLLLPLVFHHQMSSSLLWHAVTRPSRHWRHDADAAGAMYCLPWLSNTFTADWRRLCWLSYSVKVQCHTVPHSFIQHKIAHVGDVSVSVEETDHTVFVTYNQLISNSQTQFKTAA